MTTYNVSWEIEIDADTPEEATRIALEIQRDPSSLATVFAVSDEDTVYMVDNGEIQATGSLS